MLRHRIRAHLCEIAGRAQPVTYQALAQAMALAPPNTIHQVTMALEQLIEEDAAAGRPLIAALVIGKARGGLPAPGFFECAGKAGRFDGEAMGPDAAVFYAQEFQQAVAFWKSFSPE